MEQKRVSQSIILINTSRNVLFNVPLTAVSYAEGKYSIYCTVPSPRLQVFKNATSFPLFLPLWVHECRECKNADEEAKVTAQCINNISHDRTCYSTYATLLYRITFFLHNHNQSQLLHKTQSVLYTLYITTIYRKW